MAFLLFRRRRLSLGFFLIVLAALSDGKLLYRSRNKIQTIIYGGGHWGILEIAKPKEKSSKIAKPQKNSAKTENRIQNRQKPIQW